MKKEGSSNTAGTGPPPVLSTVSRSGRVESRHRGALVVVRHDEVVLAIGDADAPVYARSAVKPFQALPLLERGVADRLGCDPRHLALMSASHDGTAMHREIAGEILAMGGFAEGDLLCGPHAPFEKASRLELARSGGRPDRLHNNCSGKHAGFLLLAQALGVSPADYLDPESASQREIRAVTAAMCGLDDLEVGIDGCGAPTFWLPLTALARGFAHLTNPEGLPSVRRESCARLLAAISDHPEVLSGRERFCAALVRSVTHGIYPKNGAEGVYGLGLPGTGIGLAVKVEDGAERGYQPVVVAALRALGALSDAAEPGRVVIDRFGALPVWNTQRQRVGEVASIADLFPLGSLAEELYR